MNEEDPSKRLTGSKRADIVELERGADAKSTIGVNVVLLQLMDEFWKADVISWDW